MASSAPILREPSDYDEGHHECPGPDPFEQGGHCPSIQNSRCAVKCEFGRVSVLERRHSRTVGYMWCHVLQ